MPLNENAQKWVAALRSGNYTQGKGTLHEVRQSGEERFCCLGVACELYAAEHHTPDYVRFLDDKFAYNGQTALPPDEVTEWLGLAFKSGLHYPNAGERGRNLSERNDIDGFTFEQIADVIESDPPGLFKKKD